MSTEPLKWIRVEAGHYVAGPYRVVKKPLHSHWYARGPGGDTVGVPEVHATKAAAQKACSDAASRKRP